MASCDDITINSSDVTNRSITTVTLADDIQQRTTRSSSCVSGNQPQVKAKSTRKTSQSFTLPSRQGASNAQPRNAQNGASTSANVKETGSRNQRAGQGDSNNHQRRSSTGNNGDAFKTVHVTQTAVTSTSRGAAGSYVVPASSQANSGENTRDATGANTRNATHVNQQPTSQARSVSRGTVASVSVSAERGRNSVVIERNQHSPTRAHRPVIERLTNNSVQSTALRTNQNSQGSGSSVRVKTNTHPAQSSSRSNQNPSSVSTTRTNQNNGTLSVSPTRANQNARTSPARANQRATSSSPSRANQTHARRASNQQTQRAHSSNYNNPENARLAHPEQVAGPLQASLDPSQLSVDVLQSTPRNCLSSETAARTMSRSRSPSPTRRVMQWFNENNEALPDILNSHLLPPYAPPRQNQHRSPNRSNRSPSNQNRATPQNRNRSRRQHRNGSSHRGITQLEGNDKNCCTKYCCLHCLTVLTTFRWLLVAVAILGVICVALGIVLGSLHMTTQQSLLTLSLLFIGLGVLLVVLVGVGWRCTPMGHEPCHVLFSLGAYSNHRPPSNRRNRTRRDREWHGGQLYDEFPRRRPPPTYQVSQQRAAAQAQNTSRDTSAPANGSGSADDLSLPSSPPPTYRSRASTCRPGIHITFPHHQGGDYPASRPPTYRSHISDVGDHVRPGISHIVNQDGAVSDNGGTEHGASVLNGNRSDMIVLPPQRSVVETHPMPGTSVSAQRGTTEGDSNQVIDSENGIGTNGALSTLHRANEVVQYLDGVLNEQSSQFSHSPSPDTPPRTSMVLTPNGTYEENTPENESSSHTQAQQNQQPVDSSTSIENPPSEISTGALSVSTNDAIGTEQTSSAIRTRNADVSTQTTTEDQASSDEEVSDTQL